jgi:DNA-binding response OmpR family regulator
VLVVDADEAAAEVWARVIETAGVEVDRLVGDAVVPELRGTAYGCVVVNASGATGSSTGYRIIDAIRHDEERQARRVGIVLVLAHAKNRIFAWESGIDELLVLPVDAERLVDAVTGVLDRTRAERRAHREASLEAARRGDPAG